MFIIRFMTSNLVRFSSTIIVSLFKDNESRELLVTKKIWVQLLHPWGYCTLLVVVHRCHSWVGLLVCFLPRTICVALCGTVKASPQGGGFQVTLEQSSSLLGLFLWHSIILCRLFISTPVSVCPHLYSFNTFHFSVFFIRPELSSSLYLELKLLSVHLWPWQDQIDSLNWSIHSVAKCLLNLNLFKF